jgi:hypothetical protein
MKFQLLKLIIWPKSENVAPRTVDFEPGKVNVITGASRTGKTAIIPIIDYCLASSDCFIPIDTIRNYASWYGVVFETETEQILISRKVPDGNKVSNEYYISRGSVVSIPPAIKEANEKTEGIKIILNTVSSIPYFSLDGDTGNKGYQAHLGFRDLMALVFQNQDIVANQNILFYKTHTHEHRERLRNWFPFILDAENIDILNARQRLQEIEKRLSQLKREYERAKAHSDKWMASMLGHLKIAKEYGLLEEDITDTTEAESLLESTKRILENIPEHSQTKIDNIERANDELTGLEVEEEQLSTKIGIAKKRLNDLKKLKSGLVDYGNAVRKRVDRLSISQWLNDIVVQSAECPACGSKEHPNSCYELTKIASAFKKYEDESKKVAEVPTSFSREEARINSELENLLEQKKIIQKRFDLLMARDKKVQEEFQRRKSMFFFLGHLQASFDTFQSLGDGGEFKEEIAHLENERAHLIKLTDRNGVQRRIESATTKISQGILNHLQTLDVENKYRKIAPKFDIKDLNISVLSDDRYWHFLSEVGSASNWVSFHIALMCSLQEYFLEQKTSCVPSFVIFDQPSQVYFPKLKKSDKNSDEDAGIDPKYENEDVEAVRCMFKTIANSVVNQSGAWQSIILDHADEAIYGGIEGVHEVEVWRNGKKLIPEEWYK